MEEAARKAAEEAARKAAENIDERPQVGDRITIGGIVYEWNGTTYVPVGDDGTGTGSGDGDDGTGSGDGDDDDDDDDTTTPTPPPVTEPTDFQKRIEELREKREKAEEEAKKQL